MIWSCDPRRTELLYFQRKQFTPLVYGCYFLFTLLAIFRFLDFLVLVFKYLLNLMSTFKVNIKTYIHAYCSSSLLSKCYLEKSWTFRNTINNTVSFIVSLCCIYLKDFAARLLLNIYIQCMVYVHTDTANKAS